jgi:hypothetical protein
MNATSDSVADCVYERVTTPEVHVYTGDLVKSLPPRTHALPAHITRKSP